MSNFKEFLKKKNVNFTVQAYLIDALGAMAFGLFASLLIGTIFDTLGQQLHIESFNVIAQYAKSATGAALGVAIAHALKSATAGALLRRNGGHRGQHPWADRWGRAGGYGGGH